MIVIPMIDSPSFIQEISLSNISYRLKFNWNYRAQFWTMSILDVNDTVIIYGIRLVIGYPLLLQFKAHSLLPAGDFWCMDTDKSTMFTEPGRKDFFENRQLQLIYVGDDE